MPGRIWNCVELYHPATQITYRYGSETIWVKSGALAVDYCLQVENSGTDTIDYCNLLYPRSLYHQEGEEWYVDGVDFIDDFSRIEQLLPQIELKEGALQLNIPDPDNPVHDLPLSAGALQALAFSLIALVHAPLGIEVLRRGIIFIDLAIAQIAGLGVVAVRVYQPEADWLWVQAAALLCALLAALFFLLLLARCFGLPLPLPALLLAFFRSWMSWARSSME